MNKKEWYCLLGTTSGGLGLGILLLGTESLQIDSHTTFNFYDTYYAIPSLYANIALVVLSFFIVYLGRMLYSNFRITAVNLIFIAATILMMTLIFGLTTLVNGSFSDNLDSLNNPELIDTGQWADSFHNLLTIIQGFLLGLLAISGIKTLQLLKTRYFY
ncbi:hypothetical protein PP178_04955 [Zeaxanthinibacter sp. PT1]|uniref:hypothetical protein n=1 Tax=Zeaxanthinibacter TaxID=561554 RepID=UPI00234B698F|nr:hypothetical protein [Zeaxanthinibacter sp. PT1]MDC6350890.1 hypothetical protein [Zeaxanthinibacter sp. PT1]